MTKPLNLLKALNIQRKLVVTCDSLHSIVTYCYQAFFNVFLINVHSNSSEYKENRDFNAMWSNVQTLESWVNWRKTLSLQDFKKKITKLTNMHFSKSSFVKSLVNNKMKFKCFSWSHLLGGKKIGIMKVEALKKKLERTNPGTVCH